MMEIPLSIVAWMSVVLIQAIMHFGVIARRRRPRSPNDELLENSLTCTSMTTEDSSLDDREQEDAAPLHERKASREQIPPFIISSGSEESNDSNEATDEPEDFMLLLSQTGTEMMSVSD